MKHTRGPWIYDAGDSGDESVGMLPTPPTVYADPDGDGNVYPVATLERPARKAARDPVDEYDEGIEQDGDEAGNGPLIAAAPDMLAALRECAHVLSDLPSTSRTGTRTREAYFRATAAIRKAAP